MVTNFSRRFFLLTLQSYMYISGSVRFICILTSRIKQYKTKAIWYDSGGFLIQLSHSSYEIRDDKEKMIFFSFFSFFQIISTLVDRKCCSLHRRNLQLMDLIYGDFAGFCGSFSFFFHNFLYYHFQCFCFSKKLFFPFIIKNKENEGHFAYSKNIRFQPLEFPSV